MKLKAKSEKINSRLFTLVELLVTIVIIAILICILLPVLNKAREKGQAISCLSMQKQVNLGLTMYADAFDDYFPSCETPRGNGISGSGPEWGDGYNWVVRLWSVSTGQSLEPNEKRSAKAITAMQAYRCPKAGFCKDSVSAVQQVYGFNQNIAWIVNPSAPTRVFVKRSRIPEQNVNYFVPFRSPGNTVVIIDSVLTATGFGSEGVAQYNRIAGLDCRTCLRHDGRANALMLDGSARAVSSQDLISKSKFRQSEFIY